jgi:hypothetical protein
MGNGAITAAEESRGGAITTKATTGVESSAGMVNSTAATEIMDARRLTTTATLWPVFTLVAGAAALLIWLLLVARAVWRLLGLGIL